MTRGNAARHADVPTEGPWERWRGSVVGKHIRLIESYCKPPKGEGYGQPMKLAAFQKSFLEEALADGITTAVMPMPSGNGKSTFCAAVSVAATFLGNETGAPQVPVIATTLGQSIRSVYGVAASMVAHAPDLADRSVIFTGVSTPRIWVPRNEGLLFPISNDVDGLQGLDYSLAVCDELGFQSVEVWSSLLARTGKRARSLVIGTGTPGLDRDNALWAIREKVSEGRKPASMVFREYAADVGCDLMDREQWRKANPALVAGFMTEAGLASAIEGMPDSHARVFRLGQWVDGVEGWLGSDGRAVWDRGEDRAYSLTIGAPTWVGLDVGIKRDSTSVCSVQYRPDGRLHAEFHTWVPTADEPVDVIEVMAYLRELCDRYRVGAISFDPRFFDVPAAMLHDEGLPMIEIPQSVERMTPAIGALYTIIREGRLTHGRDSLAAQQVLNAIPRLNERGFTLSKNKSRGRIDSAISLALAVERASHKTKPRPALVVL